MTSTDVVVAVLLALAASGCRTLGVHPATPKAFAAESDPDAGDDGVIYRALSPEGVAYRVRVQDPESKAALTFWRDALASHLKDEGYLLLKASPVKAGGKHGYLLDLMAPAHAADYRFVVALFEHKGRLVIAEAAGESGLYEKARADILRAIKKIQFN